MSAIKDLEEMLRAGKGGQTKPIFEISSAMSQYFDQNKENKSATEAAAAKSEAGDGDEANRDRQVVK